MSKNLPNYETVPKEQKINDFGLMGLKVFGLCYFLHLSFEAVESFGLWTYGLGAFRACYFCSLDLRLKTC